MAVGKSSLVKKNYIMLNSFLKLNSFQLREGNEEYLKKLAAKIKRRPLYFILEDIYDTYNIGGLFRLADALCCEKIFLIGETETPPNSRIRKASVGTYKVVPWKYYKSTSSAVRWLRKNKSNIKIIAIEQSENSELYTKINYKLPLALIVGNETSGIKVKTLSLTDKVVEIPMAGINKSLNVIVSTAIVGYWAVKSF
jgi:tRNA G18 (ribose-2'-O)-methylase SpoU